jgi:Uma2 family endonuclease
MNEPMTAEHVRWTSADLALLPENGTRYEIVDGELFMSRQPHWHHQETCINIGVELQHWARTRGHGHVSTNPGVLFSDADDVVPDVVWISDERLRLLMDEAGHLTGAPELMVEVLSPGVQNERRDRQAKLKLYSEQGVQEYWIVDWRTKQVTVYRRARAQLVLVGTLQNDDELTSPLLSGFVCPVPRFFS